MLAILGAGLVGFLDDWIKIRNARNLGLNKKMKIIGLSTVAFGFAILRVSCSLMCIRNVFHALGFYIF
ncbi:MAG: hypothetical protein Ct9H90mP11_09740 [Acidimicrobiales bacterium]|nr:MAG: hypothetical protein Ct9H90mP11_09740 [Acidimicrobiales bacterium]